MKVKAKVIKAAGGSSYNVKYNSKQSDPDAKEGALYDIINPKYDICRLRCMKEESTILAQCIEAYKKNIPGFGISLVYLEHDNSTETPEMKNEWSMAEEILKYMNLDSPLKDVFEQAIEHREECGNGYLEVLRDTLNRPAELLNVNPDSIYITKLTKPVEVEYKRNGKVEKRSKKFRRFVQMDGANTKVWFKEFGDPRVMDSRTGDYVDATPPEYQATEILHLKIGDGVYGIPRWIGQVIHIVGARKAEELNYRYFIQGRHTPAAIVISNGQLSADSDTALQEYANAVEGVENAHKFLVLEIENVDDYGMKEEEQKSKIEIKSLADMLQNDALFLEYDDKSSEKTLSSFRLPPVYVGKSSDYNRATVETAKEVAEEQIFCPERESLEFIINEKLLGLYEFKYVRAQFNAPDMTNPDDQVKMLTVLNAIGGLAPNDVRQLAGDVLGKPLEAFPDAQYDVPKGIGASPAVPPALLQKSKDEQLVNVMKDVRDVLMELEGVKRE